MAMDHGSAGLDPDERISVEEGRRRVLERTAALPAEEVPLDEALGRVLAADVVSDSDVSPFDNSSMDGYAVRSADLASASPEAPALLEVVAGIGAGQVFGGALGRGQAVRLMTGAPIPEGADAVVKYELVGVARGGGGAGSLVSFDAPVAVGEAVRRAGEEFKKGEVALGAGTPVGAYALGMLASAGASRVMVGRRPRIGVISIGSELVGAGEAPGPGKIRDSNSWCLAALAREAGAEPRLYGIVPDDPALIDSALERALGECDAVMSAGGASQGDFDYIKGIVASKGKLVFSYLSLRPGKRQTFGVVSGKPVFGLSGNPAACSVGFELFIRPMLRKMQGFRALDRPRVRARLAAPIKKKEGRAFYQRGVVERGTDGGWQARECGSQSSALLSDLERCNCLIIVPQESMGLDVGAEVECMRIDLPEGAQA